jgi:hypothetical protein
VATKPNYQFEKKQRDQAKKKKQDAKRQKKQEKSGRDPSGGDTKSGTPG